MCLHSPGESKLSVVFLGKNKKSLPRLDILGQLIRVIEIPAFYCIAYVIITVPIIQVNRFIKWIKYFIVLSYESGCTN